MFATSISLLLLCNGLLPTDGGMPDPKNAWQLGDKAAAYNTVVLRDAEHPKVTDPIKVASGFPPLNFKAFSLNGADDYASVYIQAEKYTDISFAMFIYTESTTGTLFHFKTIAESELTEEILATIDNGSVIVEIKDNNDHLLTFPSVMQMDQWHRFIIKFDLSKTQVDLEIDGHITSQPLSETLGGIGDADAAYMSIGRTERANKNYFAGKITCVLMFSDKYEDKDHAEAYTMCDAMTPSSAPTNIIDLDIYLSMPVTLWTLDDVSFGYSSADAPPLYPPDAWCSRLSESSPDLPGRRSLLLDGAYMSYVDLGLPFSVLQGQFQITLFVKAEFPSSGNLVHFLYDGPEAGIREIRLSVAASDVTLTLCDHVSCCGSVTHSAKLSPGSWHFVILEKSGLVTGLYIDGIYSSVTDTCNVGSTVSSQNGTLRLGNAFTIANAFRGSVTCLGLYQKVETASDRFNYHTLFCQNASSVFGIQFDQANCSQTPTSRCAAFILTNENTEPDQDKSLIPANITSSHDRFECGSLCMEKDFCRAFAVDVSSSVDNCRLYDFVTRDGGLKVTSNVDYFVISDEQCG